MVIGFQAVNDFVYIVNISVDVRMSVVMAFFMSVLMPVVVVFFMSVLMTVVVTFFMSMFMPVVVAFFMSMLMSVVVAFFMSMLMLVTIFLQMNIKVIRIQSTDYLPSKMQMIPIHSQTSQRPLQHVSVSAQIQQRSYCHISANSGTTFQIQYFSHNHFTANRFICVARYPAPYPLSIFTTEIPLAQEFNIVSNADKP